MQPTAVAIEWLPTGGHCFVELGHRPTSHAITSLVEPYLSRFQRENQNEVDNDKMILYLGETSSKLCYKSDDSQLKLNRLLDR